MANTKTQKSFMDKITDFTMKIAEPLGKLADIPAISAIQDGLVSIMSIIIVGSIFLILGVLSSNSVGTSGQPLIPFLAPWSSKFYLVNSLTLSFMGLYGSITIAMSYAEKIGVAVKSAAIIGIVSFIIFTTGAITDGAISVTAFSASGLFVGILTSLLSVKIYKLFVDKNITIKMPDSVPPNIGNAFTALIPYSVIIFIAWFIRQILNFDMVAWFSTALSPIVTGADNVFVFTSKNVLQNLLWAVGLHGDNMLGSLFTPFTTIWLEENAAAMASGVSAYNLPHIMASNMTDRLSGWTATVWPLVFLMIRSKVKYLKALGIACLPAAIFTIVEPVVFGLPLALNPFLFVPFLVVTAISSTVGYLMMQFGFVARFYASLPWATPPFLLGPLGTGDWKSIIIVVVSFVIGLVIYFPFWRQFEKSCLEKEKAKEAENKGVTIN